MPVSGIKLRKVSSTAFQEGDPPEDREKQPLEWQKWLKTINIRVKNLRLVTGFHVNEVDSFYRVFDRQKDEPEATANVRSASRIVGDVDQDDFRDSIYVPIETEKGSGTYTLERVKGRFTFQVRAGETTSSNDGKFKDVYWGNMGRYDFEPGDDGIWLELTAPQSCIDQIASTLSSNPDAELSASVSVNTFTYEVDDALREHYHSRDMFMDGGACHAFLTYIQVDPRGEGVTPSAGSGISEEDYGETEPQTELSDAALCRNQSTMNAAGIVAALKSVRLAIYIAALAIVLALLS